MRRSKLTGHSKNVENAIKRGTEQVWLKADGNQLSQYHE